MRFAICNELYGARPFGEVCADVAAAGYDGVEVAPFALDPDPSRIGIEEAREAGDAARAAGLSVAGLHWLLAAPAGLHLTTPDDAVRARTVAHLEHLARACAAMGGGVMVLGSPQQRSTIVGDAPDAARTRALEACRAVCETAAPLGVTLALEPLSAEVTDFLTTAAEGARFVDDVDHPACALHLDCAAMAAEGRPVADTLAPHAGRIAHIHANSADLGPPEAAELAPVAHALRAGGYGGWVSVEVLRTELDGPEVARVSMAALRAAFA